MRDPEAPDPHLDLRGGSCPAPALAFPLCLQPCVSTPSSDYLQAVTRSWYKYRFLGPASGCSIFIKPTQDLQVWEPPSQVMWRGALGPQFDLLPHQEPSAQGPSAALSLGQCLFSLLGATPSPPLLEASADLAGQAAQALLKVLLAVCLWWCDSAQLSHWAWSPAAMQQGLLLQVRWEGGEGARKWPGQRAALSEPPRCIFTLIDGFDPSF